MKKVGIFTANSVDKIHPRIIMQMEILKGNGYEVTLFKTDTKRDSFFWEIINWLSLKYYKWGTINRFKKEIDPFDIIHVYDLQLMPLVKHAKKKGKRTVYETLDDNVFLHFYGVSKVVKPLSLFKNAITRRMSAYERNTSNQCDVILVNSPNLIRNFPEQKASYLPYASPLEPALNTHYNKDKSVAFVYLGKLTAAKGAKEYLELLERYNLPLFFFGKAFDSIAEKVSGQSRVSKMGNLNPEELRIELVKLAEQFNLIGLSIIYPENESYRLQEANKDIDYIALGIPFIGNDRPPTLEKIKSGVGVLWKDDEAILRLINNEDAFYDNAILKCKEVSVFYSADRFKKEFIEIYSRLIP
jgi:glycosyltransferase involved in cell wall biosynthesis